MGIAAAIAAFALVACSGSDDTNPGTPDATGGTPGEGGSGGSPNPVQAGDAGQAGTPNPIGPSTPEDPGVPVSLALSAADEATLSDLNDRLATLDSLGSADLVSRHSIAFSSELGYDPLGSAGFAELQASPLALGDAELAAFAQQGFVVSGRLHQPTMLDAYAAVYASDLPVYVTVDSVLEAVHRSYDRVLQNIETQVLRGQAYALLGSVQRALAASGVQGDTRTDLDVFIAVARSLLEDTAVAPVDAANAAAVQEIVAKAKAGTGTASLTLFGSTRLEDFSQFTPRGHYTDSPELSAYFRALIWLGRVDFRLIETEDASGERVFRRRAADAAIALRLLMDSPARDAWATMDRVITAFVGEHDSMTPPEVDALLADLGVTDLDGLAAVSDDKLASTLAEKGYGRQRIASRIMINGTDAAFPLDVSFAMFGQRYVIDSHVFSNVVYDRAGGGTIHRLMPSTLDVAYAALGNDQAASLLSPELETWGYAPDLEKMRLLVDEHPASFWEGSLYSSWLGALRALSPAADLSALPAVARSEAWGRRVLNAQLGSWAELRHDTILYAKQSYTGGESCAFPDAYVDPYPAAFEAIAAFASRAAEVVGAVPGLSPERDMPGYFVQLGTIAQRLGRMAEAQRAGNPHSAEDVEFINQAVYIEPMCGGGTPNGWYKELFFDPWQAIEFDPTIADVHTQPTDEGGAMVGRVLHVGTGLPRLMTTSVQTCEGPRLYVGPVFAYHERVTEGFDRLTDERWQQDVMQTPPADVPWLEGVVVR